MTRTSLIQALIFKFKYKSYLEIGCQTDVNFNYIVVDHKVGVDPNSGGTIRATSDDFFETNTEKFDIIFIDGLHVSDQVDRDITNSLKFLNENGSIIMHDCNPLKKEHQEQNIIDAYIWNGDVWKSFVRRRRDPNLDMATGNFDHGCGVIRVRPNTEIISYKKGSLTWENLELNRQEWLRLMSYQELINWI